MKITLISSFVLFTFWNSIAQTNAPDITPIDCGGNPHVLSDELNLGKVIVIGWTMPCASCAPPLLDVHNAVLNFMVSNPGVVEYWVNDDFQNTPCNSVQNWCVSNGITNATYFSTNVMNMNDFGGAGMPKVVVIGCTERIIYYNVNGSPTGADVTAAINTALQDIASGCQLSIEETTGRYLLNPYPNPTSKKVSILLNKSIYDSASVDFFGVDGKKITTVSQYQQTVGDDIEITFDFHSVTNGTIFLNITNYHHGQESYPIQINH